MTNLFRHLVKVAVSTLLVAVVLNWYGRHQETLVRLVGRFQAFKALL